MSYAATTTVINTVTGDAAFRAWGSAYAAKWASMGLVKTADTGQINWTTVTSPAVANTPQGYEIWRFDDALQATAPVFLKIEYGGGASASAGSLWFTVGSGSDGTGNLSGVLTPRQQVASTATVTGIPVYWSGDTHRLGFASIGTTVALSMGLWIERIVDASGVVTAEGVLIIYRGSSVWGQLAWNGVTGPYTATFELSLGAMGPSLAPYGYYGTQVAIYPIFHSKGVFLPPGLNAFVYESALITSGSLISFTVYGASHTYMPLPSGFANASRIGFSSASNVFLMMRYE